MKKKSLVFWVLSILISLVYAKDFSQIKKGDSKAVVIKKLGNPARSFLDGESEYDIWIDGDKIWVTSFFKNEVDSEPSEIEDLFTALLELKNAFSGLGELGDMNLTEDVQITEKSEESAKENDDLISKIEVSVVECKIYESWDGTKKLGFRIKLKNRSEKEISEVKVVTYYHDKEGNIFFEDTVYPVSDYSSVVFKPNYSIFYPESSDSYHPIKGIDLDEWDGGKVDFVIESVKVK